MLKNQQVSPRHVVDGWTTKWKIAGLITVELCSMHLKLHSFDTQEGYVGVEYFSMLRRDCFAHTYAKNQTEMYIENTVV